MWCFVYLFTYLNYICTLVRVLIFVKSLNIFVDRLKQREKMGKWKNKVYIYIYIFCVHYFPPAISLALSFIYSFPSPSHPSIFFLSTFSLFVASLFLCILFYIVFCPRPLTLSFSLLPTPSLPPSLPTHGTFPQHTSRVSAGCACTLPGLTLARINNLLVDYSQRRTGTLILAGQHWPRERPLES